MPLWIPSSQPWDPTTETYRNRLSLSSPDKNESRAQALLSNIAVRGLPRDQFVLPLESEIVFTDPNAKELRFALKRHHRALRDIDCLQYAWAALENVLPSDISYFSTDIHGGGISFYIQTRGDHA